MDTDTTVHTLYGQQMGGRKGYNPKNKGKKSYQPILTFIAETKEYISGELRNGDRPTGKQIGHHIRSVCAAVPKMREADLRRGPIQGSTAGMRWRLTKNATPGSSSWPARQLVWSRKLRQAEWQPSNKTDAEWECEFRYRPDGWRKEYRFLALRYEKTREEKEAEAKEQYQLFETSQYKYRVLVSDMADPIYFVVWFYNQRGGAENLIKEANNDAGLAAHPSGRFDVNGNHFQLAMLAYNLNCWLMLFNREPQANADAMHHTTLATSRLRFLFVAAKIWRHAGRTGVSYSDSYEEKGVFERLMDRLRRITPRGQGYAPVMQPALC